MKKAYVAPQLSVHGDVARITMQCNLDNADTPDGNSNAFPGNNLPCVSPVDPQ